MPKVVYSARSLKDGEVVWKKESRRKGRILDFVRDQIDKGRTVVLKRKVKKEKFTIEPASKWGRSTHDPYQFGDQPVGTEFAHTSVTKHLEATASVKAEREQMRQLDAIAKGRGFNGISYSQCIFPSGRAYEGRGWGVVEAATEGYNQSSDSICFVGNNDVFKPTRAALEAAVAVTRIGQQKGALAKRGLAIRGHREVAPKACPGRFITDEHLRQIERAVA